MELRQLEYLVAVVEQASFTRAAALLHVTQPGVSAQIRLLEAELGQQLLDRSERTVRPTHAGDVVLPYARAALVAISSARQAVDDLVGLRRGRIAVGTVAASSFAEALPDLLAAFHEAHPAVEITLTEANSDLLLEALHAGSLDMAFVGLSGKAPEGIETQVIADEAIVAAVALADPLAKGASVPLAGLKERSLISLPRGTGLRSALEAACAKAGFRPRIALEASSLNVLVHLASRGLGVAILPGSVAATHHKQLHALTITRPQLRARIDLAWRADGPMSPAARALLSMTRTALTTAGTGRSNN